MKTVAYHRTSTADQHLDRGIAEIQKYCIQFTTVLATTCPH